MSLGTNGIPQPSSNGDDVTAEPGESLVVNTPEWAVMNRRRVELIRKKNREGLTADEHAEYERLQRLAQAALEKAYPSPNLFTERLAELEARSSTSTEVAPE